LISGNVWQGGHATTDASNQIGPEKQSTGNDANGLSYQEYFLPLLAF